MIKIIYCLIFINEIIYIGSISTVYIKVYVFWNTVSVFLCGRNETDHHQTTTNSSDKRLINSETKE
jgi:hypothetical protein